MAQQPLGLPQGTPHAKCQHDGLVAPKAAVAVEDVIDERAVEARGAHHLGALHALLAKQLEKVVGKLAVDGQALVEIGLRRRRRQQALKQLLCQTLFGHGAPPFSYDGTRSAPIIMMREARARNLRDSAKYRPMVVQSAG